MCGGSGYKGRCGLHELMIASDAVKRLIQERARVTDLFVKSVEEGMSTLKMDGMDKVMMGLTGHEAGSDGLHQVDRTALTRRVAPWTSHRP